jgi:hypothetical protein
MLLFNLMLTMPQAEKGWVSLEVIVQFKRLATLIQQRYPHEKALTVLLQCVAGNSPIT